MYKIGLIDAHGTTQTLGLCLLHKRLEKTTPYTPNPNPSLLCSLLI